MFEKYIKKQCEKTSYYEIKIPIFIFLTIVAIGIFLGEANFDNIILLLTLGALLWYSFETRQLKNVTQRQLEPILFIYLDKEEQFLYISNLGKTAASNVFIKPINIGNNKIEFNILRPIYYINIEKEKKIETTVSSGSSRTFGSLSSVDPIISNMRQSNLDKVEIIVEYDTSFKIKETVIFIFDISGHMTDTDDSVRICKIYQKF